jgi:hypothetical protein
MGMVCMLCGAPQAMFEALSAAKDLGPVGIAWALYQEPASHQHHGDEPLPGSAALRAAMTSIQTTRGNGAHDTFGQPSHFSRAAAWQLQNNWQLDEVIPAWSAASTTPSSGTQPLV